jgi:uncharacterized protein YndB with AHSA1/START domain
LVVQPTKENPIMKASLAVVLLALLLSYAAPVAAQSAAAPPAQSFTRGAVQVTKTLQPVKQLDFEVEVPASIDDVWKAFTTADGMATWVSPEAEVELREGGNWLAKFPGAASGGGTIVKFTPLKDLAISAMAPEAFPTVRRERTLAVFNFTVVDQGHTRVHLRQTGWKEGEEWTKAFAYLAEGNAILLNMLHDRFVNGPINWKKMMEPK